MDTDGDGTADCNDGCPNDAAKIAPGICGCGVSDVDTDGDGTADCNDPTPYGVDFGDAPDPTYATLLASDGARHGIVPGFFLGAGVDFETDGQPDVNALGDDNNGNADEDGVTFDTPIVAGQFLGLTVSASAAGFLDAWIDFDGDGGWEDPGEQIFTGQALVAGANGLNIFVPPDADTLNTLFARFRFSSTGGLSNTGFALDGEVEDYTVSILADADGDGVPDINDGCPNDAAKIGPGTCGCGVSDVDTDGDGAADCHDACLNDAAKIAPGVCGCGVSDMDTDGDGASDCHDGCPDDPAKTAPGVCGCGISDMDTDNDGVPDCNDGCPDDPAKTAPGVCGCGASDVDTDGDFVSDCKDGCPFDPHKTAPGACGCNVADADSDGDGTPDCLDGTPDGNADGGTLVCDFLPWLISPADGATAVSLAPTLEVAFNLDPINCGVHRETRWQISGTPGFEILLYNVNPVQDDPAFHQVEQGVLKADTTYYWRARVGCGSGCLSDYSETFSFTTGPDSNDNNNNGMPDDQEVNDSGNHSRSIRTVIGNIVVVVETSADITSLQSLDHRSVTNPAGRPDRMPWGLIRFRIDIADPGDTVPVTISFIDAAQEKGIFYSYSPEKGFGDYSEYIVALAPDKESLIIEIQDGGFGDLDGAVNGVIVGSFGIGQNAGGGGGCFLEVIDPESPH